jgi:AhpD family alkylhydroperoxidase
MPRIPMVEPSGEPDVLRPVFDQLRSTRGAVPGMYRVLAQQPAVLAAHRAYFHAALDTGTLPRTFKEKIACKVAQLRNTPYCMGSHRRYAIKHGVAEAELAAIGRSDYRSLEPREVAAFELAEAIVQRDDASVGELLQRLQTFYSADAIVEIVALIGIMELACTFAGVFGLAPDRSD